MNEKGEHRKLDWMYKGANSLIDREDYLLGKSVDKPLEQINAEEKEKRLGLVPPKNHVEHECIPPSIRDFNKIIQSEQVDLSAKLQEDPLVAIRKREEEARRQFLQNPVQLKKLQDALKVQELKKRKKKLKKSSCTLDEQLKNKLKQLKNGNLGIGLLKKHEHEKKTDDLDTILMHKFNQLKDKLSEKDMDDILAGKSSSDSEEDTKKKISGEDSENDGKKHSNHIFYRKNIKIEKHSGEDRIKKSGKNYIHKMSHRSNSRSSEESDSENDKRKYKFDRGYQKNKTLKEKEEKFRKNYRSRSRSSDEDKKRKKGTEHRIKYISNSRKIEDTKEKRHKSPETKIESESNLDRLILEKLRMLRDSQPANVTNRGKESSDESEEDTVRKDYSYQDSEDEYVPKKKTFGLVRPDGTSIPLNRKSHDETDKPAKKVESVASEKLEPKKKQRLTEKEKEERRKQMMADASKREIERSENLKRYRQEDEREQKSSGSFDKNFVHKELLKSTKNATVESRLKSNLNNIQRSSKHMNSNFSKR
ncbi:hypothetical protein JTB14_006675 [Gonioctena quinquepunctata]|nr:hypothetical protein JTB14_006675 [Gonioctena quinquepunctata]